MAYGLKGITRSVMTSVKSHPFQSVAGGSAQGQPVPPINNGVLSDFQKAQESANAANEARYQQILEKYNQLIGSQGGAIAGVPQDFQNIADAYKERTATATGMLDSFGNTQREQLAQRKTQAESSAIQSLINRGLYNTGAYDSAIRGNNQDYEANARALEESIMRQKLGVTTQLTGEELQARGAVPRAKLDVANQQFNMGQAPLGVMERRNDVGPNLAEVSQYAQFVGAANAPMYLNYGSGAGVRQPPQLKSSYSGYLDLS